ncbi:MAG: pyrroline-5-carboxylate reductase [Actinomycetota bacterium]|nr:pyrroline-5-carboxylate reductase [Actinomycetota bacterium]
MSSPSLVIIGGGNMGAALARGLLSKKLKPAELVIVEASAERRQVLQKDFPGVQIVEQMQNCESAIIAVKPNDVVAVCSLLNSSGVKQVLSIAAGVTIASLESACGNSISVIRAMPNTPAIVGQGASAISAGQSCSVEQINWAKEILQSVGIVVVVEESLLDTVTGLSGSGPAYVFLLAEALISAGVQQGLSSEISNTLVRQLLVGSSVLLAQSSESPSKLRQNVTSPNGTTAAGIAELQSKQFAEIIAAAVRAATARSVELGE